MSEPQSDDLVLVCRIVGPERYVIAFPPSDLEAAINAVAHWAADDRLAFDWSDAQSMVAAMKVQAAK